MLSRSSREAKEEAAVMMGFEDSPDKEIFSAVADDNKKTLTKICNLVDSLSVINLKDKNKSSPYSLNHPDVQARSISLLKEINKLKIGSGLKEKGLDGTADEFLNALGAALYIQYGNNALAYEKLRTKLQPFSDIMSDTMRHGQLRDQFIKQVGGGELMPLMIGVYGASDYLFERSIRSAQDHIIASIPEVIPDFKAEYNELMMLKEVLEANVKTTTDLIAEHKITSDSAVIGELEKHKEELEERIESLDQALRDVKVFTDTIMPILLRDPAEMRKLPDEKRELQMRMTVGLLGEGMQIAKEIMPDAVKGETKYPVVGCIAYAPSDAENLFKKRNQTIPDEEKYTDDTNLKIKPKYIKENEILGEKINDYKGCFMLASYPYYKEHLVENVRNLSLTHTDFMIRISENAPIRTRDRVRGSASDILAALEEKPLDRSRNILAVSESEVKSDSDIVRRRSTEDADAVRGMDRGRKDKKRIVMDEEKSSALPAIRKSITGR